MISVPMVFQRTLKMLDWALTAVMVTLVAVMVVSISSEIVLREVVQALFLKFGESSPEWLTKLSAPLNTASQTLLVWIGLLGSALAYRHRAHLGVDALVRIYPVWLQTALDRISTVLVALFSGSVLVYGGFVICRRAWTYDSRMPGFQELNIAWFYAVLPITGVLLVIYSVDFLLHPRKVESELGNEEKPERP